MAYNTVGLVVFPDRGWETGLEAGLGGRYGFRRVNRWGNRFEFHPGWKISGYKFI